jgi:hypothetical protein
MKSIMETSPKKKLLDQVRDAIRLKHYSYRTEETYVQWIRRYILFHNKRHPQEMGVPEIEAFLTHLATVENVAASTQNQAFCALLFLYRHVLQIPLDDRIDALRARRSRYLPTVLTPEEAKAIIQAMSGVYRLLTLLLYGSGLRLREVLQLRIKVVPSSAHSIATNPPPTASPHSPTPTTPPSAPAHSSPNRYSKASPAPSIGPINPAKSGVTAVHSSALDHPPSKADDYNFAEKTVPQTANQSHSTSASSPHQTKTANDAIADWSDIETPSLRSQHLLARSIGWASG